MRVSAYVLVADPAFLRESILAYYDRVDRIVLSYDETSTSWTGTPLPVAECLGLIESVDTEHKCVRAPGRYARLGHHPLENDTFQRQCALAEASDGADWVLQLDTDEVVLDAARFFRALRRAEATGSSGLDFPARWLYAHVGRRCYLEASSRFWRARGGYPGPVAVRAGTRLVQARQAEVPLYRVDLRPWNTDPSHHHLSSVHETVPLDSAIAHYSWVRDDETMRRKFGWSGHTDAYSKPEVYRRWVARQRHPVRTVLTTPFRRDDWFRLARVPEARGASL
ncbi:MAG TPA: hypothetical protein VIJ18_16965 [Microbacteriaceae bacterium]